MTKCNLVYDESCNILDNIQHMPVDPMVSISASIEYFLKVRVKSIEFRTECKTCFGQMSGNITVNSSSSYSRSSFVVAVNIIILLI